MNISVSTISTLQHGSNTRDYLDLQDNFQTLLCTTFYHLISNEIGNKKSFDNCYKSGGGCEKNDINLISTAIHSKNNLG